MTTLSSAIPNRRALVARMERKAVRIRARPSRGKKSIAEADFFRMAAAFAHPDPEIGPQHLGISDDLAKDLSLSSFLDQSHQEKSATFIAMRPRARSSPKGSKQNLLNTWQLPINIVSIMEKQVPKTSTLSVIEFHASFTALLNSDNGKPFLFMGTILGVPQNILIDSARHFWSHRLNIKSMQTMTGASPSVRYFHAALRSSEEPTEKIDIFYWLKFDDQQQPLHGEFIDPLHQGIVPQNLFSFSDLLEKLIRRRPSSTLAKPWEQSMKELLPLYQEVTALGKKGHRSIDRWTGQSKV